MLKYFFIPLLISLLFVIDGSAQTWRFPNCGDLEVTNMYFGLNGSDTLYVTVRNNCDTCGQNVYTGLIAYLNEDAFAIEDELYTKPSPYNNDEFEYTLLKNSQFELSDDLRFEMVLLCDTIKYADDFTIKVSHILINEERIMINPNLNCNEIFIDGDFTNYSITIQNEVGNAIANYTGANSPLNINTTPFEDQLYFLSIQHQNLQNVSLQTIITSCNNEDEEIVLEPEFALFSNSIQKFEFYFEDTSFEPNNANELELLIVEDVEIEDKLYTGFEHLDETNSFFVQPNQDNILDYNFVPIRYEDGNYYELREQGEVVFLKDDMNVGDVWFMEFIDDQKTIIYTFELINIFEIYNELETTYEDVYQVKEVIDNSYLTIDNQTSMHYYNKEVGIIRREIAIYISSAYLPITFNRVE